MPKHSTIFRKFLVSYLIILVIPSIAGFVSYRTSIEVTQSVSIENGVTQLERSKEILERRMAEVEGFTRQLALNPDLNTLMNEKKRGDRDNVYGIWSVMRQVMPFSQTNDFLQNYFIYLTNYDVILSQGSAYFRPEHYYQNFRYSDLTLEEWKSAVLDRTHRSEIMPLRAYTNKTKQTSVVTYMQSLPLDSFSGPSPATVVVIIDEENISSLLSGLEERYGGWAHISDAEGNTVSLQGIGEEEARRLSADESFDPAKVSQFYNDDLVITIRSDKNGWIYQAGIPRHVLMENANQIKTITWLVTGVALLLGLLTGLLLAYRNSAPINRLLGVMKEHFGKEGVTGRNEFDFLQGNISSIISSNRQLEDELNRQLPLVRDGFLKRLIAGEFRAAEELAAAAAQADARFQSQQGFVGVLQINGYSGMDSVEILNEMTAARLIVKQMLAELGSGLWMTDLGSDRIVAICTACAEEGGFESERERENITETFEKLIQLAYREYKIHLTASFGEPFLSLPEASHSFEQAKRTMDFAEYDSKQSIVWFGDAKPETATYYYPLDIEQRLIGTIRAGDRDEARRMVQSVIEKNTENRQLSIEMKQQLVGELKGTLLKLLDQKAFLGSELLHALKNQIVGVQASNPAAVIQEEIIAIVDSLCGVIASKKSHAHIQIVEEIKRFIAESYGDAELTLYRIAEKAERPEKYISQLFKEVTDTNISDYLEKVRIERASELLKTNACTVDEIAERVGYNSAHSFRRAFKRVMGIAPSSYRQSIKI
ncbi:helix-turn-helix domain-containing protein [Paenibacillus arenilitoris]|uniref:Helix-turn-helix domain-containing protein n=1 Tax=Paenibacillus arenilitoris TaxID=2772299 RepID=A0A927H999_9BACL|nr:helix-turn-helix domain-containing protein [Paenibacillus arenilitoris]MBD2871399.1 helix-turn-helix domain-containing protein [Paenibacillus arenilitoris]